jgi:hypothetical protein
MRGLDPRRRAPLLVAFVIGAAFSLCSPLAVAAETTVADNGAKSTAGGSFESKAEAEAFLARALPAATAANPKYRSPGSDIETRWLTKIIRFKGNERRGVIVSTVESVEDYRGGALSAGQTHVATFRIDDVAITEETTDDLAENGEKAHGVLFKCVGAPCIEDQRSEGFHLGSGQPPLERPLHPVVRIETFTRDSTDIYLQDATQRWRIIEAFQALQQKSGPP